MRNSLHCNDHVNFVRLTWFWSFPSGRCGQRTWKGNCCVFPFVYRGRRYNSCTRRGSKRFWCPIVPGYKPGQAWGYCRGKQGEDIFVIRSSSNKMSSPLSNFLVLDHLALTSSKISKEECFIRSPNTEKWVEKTKLSRFFLTNFEVFKVISGETLFRVFDKLLKALI